LRPALGKYLNRAHLDKLDFHQINNLVDWVFCVEFEGRKSFPLFDKKAGRDSMYIWLKEDFTQEKRQLVYSKLMRKPLQVMRAKVEALFKGDSYLDNLKMMIYSAHDTQVQNLLTWLAPTNREEDAVVFASQVIFELHYDDECADKCPTVVTLFNGKALSFVGCEAEKCTFEQFLDYLSSIWHLGDLNEDCK